jgi:hypothetical protein
MDCTHPWQWVGAWIAFGSGQRRAQAVRQHANKARAAGPDAPPPLPWSPLPNPRRGQSGADTQVVVVANFSDFATPDAFSPSAEYVVPNWPATPPSKRWREVPQNRDVPQEKVGREAIFPWEAKVYALF